METSDYRRIKFWLNALLIMVSVIQLFLFPEFEVLFGVMSSIYGWNLIAYFVVRQDLIRQFPLPCFLLIGFGLNWFYLPLFLTIMEGKTITYNLWVPNLVFLHQSLSVTVSVITFLLFVSVAKQKKISFFRKVFQKFDIYKPPTQQQLWLMGLIGLIGQFFVYLTGEESSLARFIHGVVPFIYVPYLMFLTPLFNHHLSEEVKGSGKNRYRLVFYSLAIVVLALMVNHRAIFLKIILVLALGAFLGVLMGRLSIRKTNKKKVFIIALVLVVLTGPLLRLGKAMLVVRGAKKELTTLELAEQTFDAYFDDMAIDGVQKDRNIEVEVSSDNRLWDEHYINNIFLARLSNLKFTDLSLYHAYELSDNEQQDVRQFLYDKQWALLPQPILDMFEIVIDKETINLASFGDYIYYKSTGDYYGLKSKRQAHLEGAGYAAFGYSYLWVFAMVLFLFLKLLQLFTFRAGENTNISVAALMMIGTIYTFYNLEGITSFLGFLLRGSIQTLIIYVLMFRLTAKLSKKLPI